LLLETSDEGLEAPEDVRLHAVADARTIDLAADEPSALEDLQVLRHRRLRERELVHDVATDAGVAAHEKPQDLDPGRVADGLAKDRQLTIRRLALHGPQIRFPLRMRRGRAKYFGRGGHESYIYDTRWPRSRVLARHMSA